eukprot:TRINITY_DN5668_c0_g1_i3.p1 TRINITY_DN5668_c0_g1~~TRINITY_DN5668_c0_g1_i3.p1  ORF type:complete len:557 (-),score=40.14 TRINITY_DN5668_c0_g1_i3:134-1804(-)
MGKHRGPSVRHEPAASGIEWQPVGLIKHPLSESFSTLRADTSKNSDLEKSTMSLAETESSQNWFSPRGASMRHLPTGTGTEWQSVGLIKHPLSESFSTLRADTSMSSLAETESSQKLRTPRGPSVRHEPAGNGEEWQPVSLIKHPVSESLSTLRADKSKDTDLEGGTTSENSKHWWSPRGPSVRALPVGTGNEWEPVGLVKHPLSETFSTLRAEKSTLSSGDTESSQKLRTPRGPSVRHEPAGNGDEWQPVGLIKHPLSESLSTLRVDKSKESDLEGGTTSETSKKWWSPRGPSLRALPVGTGNEWEPVGLVKHPLSETFSTLRAEKSTPSSADTESSQKMRTPRGPSVRHEAAGNGDEWQPVGLIKHPLSESLSTLRVGKSKDSDLEGGTTSETSKKWWSARGPSLRALPVGTGSEWQPVGLIKRSLSESFSTLRADKPTTQEKGLSKNSSTPRGPSVRALPTGTGNEWNSVGLVRHPPSETISSLRKDKGSPKPAASAEGVESSGKWWTPRGPSVRALPTGTGTEWNPVGMIKHPISEKFSTLRTDKGRGQKKK